MKQIVINEVHNTFDSNTLFFDDFEKYSMLSNNSNEKCFMKTARVLKKKD